MVNLSALRNTAIISTQEKELKDSSFLAVEREESLIEISEEWNLFSFDSYSIVKHEDEHTEDAIAPADSSDMTPYNDLITLKYIIVHELDLKAHMPYLSNQLVDIDTLGNEYIEFFKKHISLQNKQKHNKLYKFKDVESEICQDLEVLAENIGDIEIFIQKTQKLTIDLHNSIMESNSKSDGVVFFIVYNVNNRYNYFSILKMKKNSRIQFNKETNSLNSLDNVLPDPKEALHKCAFIKLYKDDTEDSFDLHIIDAQTKDISKFFMRDFLNAYEISNNEVMTERVRKLLYKYIKRITRNEADFIRLKFEIDHALGEEREVVVEELVEELSKNYIECEMQRLFLTNSFVNDLQKKYVDNQFTFTAKSNIKYVSLTTPNKDIQVKYKKDLEGSKINISYEDDRTIITIHHLPLKKLE